MKKYGIELRSIEICLLPPSTLKKLVDLQNYYFYLQFTLLQM